jgi:polar amino acid transport system substrate-binding protein
MRKEVVRLITVLGCLIPSICLGDPAAAGPSPPEASPKLIVGIYSAPPFNIRQPDGSWGGIAVDLWKEIASDLNVDFEFKEITVATRFEGLMNGWFDVCIGPITITAEREEQIDFTHTFFTSGLRVATRTASSATDSNFLLPLLRQLLSTQVIKLVLLIFSILCIAAVLVWLCEHRKNAAHFGGQGRKLSGIGSALWWSAVTMTGVGYGDLYPKTLIGRVVAVAWMFSSLVLVAVFTATMASMLTAEKLSLQKTIQKPEDLRGLRVGTAANTTATQYAEKNHLNFQTLPGDQLLPALRDGKFDAVINDAPILLYETHTMYPNELTVLPIHLDEEFYGFGVKEGSSLRESINRSLLRRLADPHWNKILSQYLGESE